jgi:hypothetical protein
MQLDVVHVLMAHPEDIDLVLVQSSKGSFLKVAHHIGLLCFRGIVLSMECNDPRCISPFAGVAVDQVARQVGIAGQDFWGYISPDGFTSDAFAVFCIGGDLLCHEVLDR